jgi:hypothetical protein
MTNDDKPRGARAKKARAPRQRAKERPDGRKEAAEGGDGQEERGFLFEDPYWDDAFCSYYDPTLGTCCRR